MHTYTQQPSQESASSFSAKPGWAFFREGHSVSSTAPVKLQAKLAINTPGDIYEQEADHVAHQVMHKSEPQLQRACDCGGQCSKCQTEQRGAEHERLQTKHAGTDDSSQAAAPPIVQQVLALPGQPLDPSTRGFMERRFGHDFSHVRVHTGAKAAESAQAVNALAYTVGRNIVFGAGQYRPESDSSKLTLAHELTHVVQQTGPAVKTNAASNSFDQPTSRAERDRTGSNAAGLASETQPRAPSLARSPLALQRTVNKDFPEAPPSATDAAPKKTPDKQTSQCPAGFTLKTRATWLRCDETSGTRKSGCAFCNDGEQQPLCEEIIKLLGNHNVIAPVEGRCGSKFQITTPEPGAPVLDVVKAEIPGGDTKLDINQGVITDLGLDVTTGRYDVCLKGPVGHDDRLVISGGSACQKKKEPEKTKAK